MYGYTGAMFPAPLWVGRGVGGLVVVSSSWTTAYRRPWVLGGFGGFCGG